MKALEEQSMPSLAELRNLVYDVREQLDHIYAPLFVVQSANDDVIDPESANIIYNQTESITKKIAWYEESGHVITLGPEKEDLHKEIFQFLESLDWSV